MSKVAGENAIKAIKSWTEGKTGDLSSLATTSKTNLVAAVNEVDEESAKIGDTLSSTSLAYVREANIVDGAVTPTKMDMAALIDMLYPVGCFFETTDTSFNPNIAWGGTWVEDTAGRVLVAKDSGTFDTVGGTGGEETHTLTTSEMPSHKHSLTFHSANGSTNPGKGVPFQGNGNDVIGADPSGIGNTGGDGAHNNLQPYIVVRRWHRTA